MSLHLWQFPQYHYFWLYGTVCKLLRRLPQPTLTTSLFRSIYDVTQNPKWRFLKHRPRFSIIVLLWPLVNHEKFSRYLHLFYEAEVTLSQQYESNIFRKIVCDFILVLNSKFWPIWRGLHAIKTFIWTRNDVITVSATRWRQTKFKMADSETAISMSICVLFWYFVYREPFSRYLPLFIQRKWRHHRFNHLALP